MRRVLVSVLVLVALWASSDAQELPAVRINISVLDAGGRPIPVGRHALLISQDPVEAPPQRVVTSPDGTAQLRLRPGRYIVESDRPFVLDARSYEWMQLIEVVAGRDTTIELTTANASIGETAPGQMREAPASLSTPARDTASMLTTWQASVFGIWTPTAHAAGFLVDERGVVATSLAAIGDATSVEVQVSESVKVAGAVILADAARDVAVVRVHPSVVAGLPPVPVDCDATARTAVDADRFLLTVPLFGPKDIDESLVLYSGEAGGPVFTEDGRAIGLSSPAEESDGRGRMDVRVIGGKDICEALTSARAKLDAAAVPDAIRRPVEPARSTAATAAPATAIAGGFQLASYQFSSSDFDVTFLTPAVLAAARVKRDWTGGGADSLTGLRVATDFEHWSEYVVNAPPLLYVRATPRLVEGFWMKVARVAASTQGAAIPPIPRLRPGFSRMRLICGGKDVTPIHPFRIQTRVTETEAIEEGFYVFDPSAIGPACGTVSIVLSSVKEPDKTETRVVDPAIVARVWEESCSVARGDESTAMTYALGAMSAPKTHVVLVHPEIHWNTGNAGRTCLATGATLHLIEPLGFSLDERQVKRAGLDYWEHVDLRVWPDWATFEAALSSLGEPYFFSTHATRVIWDAEFNPHTDVVLIFGRETAGLPDDLHARYADRFLRLPMASPQVRSLNLSTAVAIGVYEVLRQRRAR